MTGRKTRKAKGAVLIMVLTVMFVLIFLLAGAVAVVYSSNRRVMQQYQESQAYYTARSVLDMYHDMILADKDVTEITGLQYYELDALTPPAGVADPTPAQLWSCHEYNAIASGRALELDLYKVPVSLDIKPEDSNYNSWYHNDYARANTETDASKKAALQKLYKTQRNFLVTEYTSDPYYSALSPYFAQYMLPSYSSALNDEAKWEDNKDYNTNEYLKNNPTTTKKATNTLVYYVNYGTNGSDFKQYQSSPTGVKTTVNKLIDEGSTVKVEVEVLDRRLYFGENTDAILTALSSGKTYAQLFAEGDRSKDTFKIKVTVTVKYENEIYTTSAVYENQHDEPNAPPASKAIISMSNISGTNSLLAIGGGSALAPKNGLITANNMNTESNIFVQCDLSSGSTDPDIFLDNSNDFFVRGTFTLDNKALQSGYFNTGAMLYAGHLDFKPKNTGVLGDSTGSQVLNIVSPLVTFSQTNNTKNAMTGKGFFSVIDLTKKGDGTAWADSDLKDLIAQDSAIFNKNGSDESGIYYCNYFVVPKSWLNDDQSGWNLNIDGNNRTITSLFGNDAKLYVCKGVVYKKDDGTYDIKPVTGALEYNTAGKGGVAKAASGEVNVHYDKYTDPYVAGATEVEDFIYHDNAEDKQAFRKEFHDLPDNLAGNPDGGKKIYVDTVRSLYADYFKNNTEDGSVKTWEAKDSGKDRGDFIDYDTLIASCIGHEDDPDNAYYTFIQEHLKTAEDSEPNLNDMGVNVVPLYNSLAKADSSFEYVDPEGNVQHFDYDGEWRIISGSCFIPQLGNMNDNANSNYIIDARYNPVTIQFGTASSNDGDVYFNHHFAVFGQKDVTVIVPSDHKGCKVHFGAGNGNFSFFDADIGRGDGSIPIKDIDLDATAAPNIKWLVSSNVDTIHFYQHTVGSICGYFTAPKTIFNQDNVDGSAPTVTRPSAYGTTNVRKQKIVVVGSVLCRQFIQAINKKAGVCYINQERKGAGTPPGQPLYRWPALYYSSN